MQWSDWSSDVCSSDLGGIAFSVMPQEMRSEFSTRKMLRRVANEALPWGEEYPNDS
jgi:hypothetical protein